MAPGLAYTALECVGWCPVTRKKSKLPRHIEKGRAGRRTRPPIRQRCRVASPPPVSGEPCASTLPRPGGGTSAAGWRGGRVIRPAPPDHCHVAVAQPLARAALPPRLCRPLAAPQGKTPCGPAALESAWHPVRADRNRQGEPSLPCRDKPPSESPSKWHHSVSGG